MAKQSRAQISNFHPMDYTSKILWHFIRDSRDKSTNKISLRAEDILINHILSKKTSGGELKNIVQQPDFYQRFLVPTQDQSLFNASVDVPTSEASVIEARENKAVCFADIPFGFLPIHMKKYNGIGLGFRRKTLVDKHSPDLRPVTYYPHLTTKLVDEISTAEGNARRLKPYTKVPSQDNQNIKGEKFDDIYREREWRIERNCSFDSSDLVCLVFRSSNDLNNYTADVKIQMLKNSGVAIFCCEDFFEHSDEGRG